MYFNDIIGQEAVKRRLIASARKDRVAHAQLFCESSGGGAGAFPLAMAYARYLNCANPSDTDACGHCPSCLKYDAKAHPDLHFVFPIVAGKERKKEVCDDYLPEWRAFLTDRIYFGLDDWLRHIEVGNSQALIYAKESDALVRHLSLRIYEANYRVLLVWLPEKMHPACANKLLKVIEEPPEHTLILMVSEETESILPTILSRAQHLYIPPLPEVALTEALIRNEQSEPTLARQAAHLAQGSYLKAKALMGDNEDNAFCLEQFKDIMRHAWARNVTEMKATADRLAGAGRERQKTFLVACGRLIRENFIYRFHIPELNYMNEPETAFAERFAPFVNERNVFTLMDELSVAEQHIAQNVNAKMVFFDLFLHIAAALRQK